LSESLECADDLDNDKNGAADFDGAPAVFGQPQGSWYGADWSCNSLTDNTEYGGPSYTGPPVYRAQCDNNWDDDGDHWVDWPTEPGCQSKTDDTEVNNITVTQCQDYKSNDGDGLKDPYNYGSGSAECWNAQDWSEEDGFQNVPWDLASNPAACSDGKDNDVPQDFIVDYPNDPGCANTEDNDENNQAAPAPTSPGPAPLTPDPEPQALSNGFACGNNVDDDGDTEIDFRLVDGKNIGDPGCYSREDTDEGNVAQCGDGVENGIDGKVDTGGVMNWSTGTYYLADPDCASPWDTTENDTDYSTQSPGQACVVDPEDGVCVYDGSGINIQVTYQDEDLPFVQTYPETYNYTTGTEDLLDPSQLKCTIFGGRLRRIESSLRVNPGIQCNFRASNHRMKTQLAYYDTFDEMVDEEDEHERAGEYNKKTYGTSTMSNPSIWPCLPSANDPNLYLTGTYTWSRVKVRWAGIPRYINIPWGNNKSKVARAACAGDA
jgi:hypothetical protein